MTFRFKAQYALLTYAQCGDLDAWSVSNLLSELGAECIIGRERHEDGGIHLHAFVDFGRRFHTTNNRKFDVGGCHPNVQPFGRTPEKGYDYAIKDGDVVAGGLERPDGSGLSTTGSHWSTILAATTKDEFYRLCEELAPRMLLSNFTSLRAFADWRFRPDPTPYEHPRCLSLETMEVAGLDEWARENLGTLSGGKSCTSRGGYPPSAKASESRVAKAPLCSGVPTPPSRVRLFQICIEDGRHC